MRLWSLHPRYLDAQGLVALWREALLAQKVLAGKTRGYRHHPQLERFRATRDPGGTIGAYLVAVADEAERRGYRFDRRKIGRARRGKGFLPVTRGQLRFELAHLLRKLRVREPARFREVSRLRGVRLHPIFRSRAGGVEAWERG